MKNSKWFEQPLERMGIWVGATSRSLCKGEKGEKEREEEGEIFGEESQCLKKYVRGKVNFTFWGGHEKRTETREGTTGGKML